ncbi:hypothetical protein ASPBRDRAFT_32569 [Aspergillus brasiliensis CBS 101740]|uniref:Uncharacterized protein n=1 Tax=Aspergillus brasiliensis (strain CBS 101740 / IMI 381727 / IBT 21946) TaxID=767769 RepID=A0A1L9UAS7_ASPBC|nr:hypothetical protein ASPBRDRAFT_32569 [Aspergillus brasiliensis CBS 101740]
MKSLNEAIDLGEEALITAEAHTGNKTLGDIVEWLRIMKNARAKIASWVPSALKPGKPGPSGQPPEETTTPDQPKTSEKWRSKISLPWKKGHASSHDNSVVAETEVLGADGSSLSPCSPSNSSLRSSLDRTRDNGQDSPGTGSERPSFPPPVPRKRSSSYYARCLEDTTKPRARS